MSEPKYTGDPKVHPEKMLVNGRPVRGWIVERVTAANEVLRAWLEPYKPGTVSPGHRVRPLVCGDDFPEGRKAPLAPLAAPAQPVAPPPPAEPATPPLTGRMVMGPSGWIAVAASKLVEEAPAPKVLHPALQELKRACNMNRNMGNKVIDISFVMQCLEKYQS